jgi:hypothetical protein
MLNIYMDVAMIHWPKTKAENIETWKTIEAAFGRFNKLWRFFTTEHPGDLRFKAESAIVRLPVRSQSVHG